MAKQDMIKMNDLCIYKKFGLQETKFW